MKTGRSSERWSLEEVEKGLLSRHAEDRLRAIAELDRMGTPEAAEILIGALEDRLSYIGGAAARSLAKIATAAHADSLVRYFVRANEGGAACDPGCSVRIELAAILGDLRYAPAEAVLRQGLWTTQIEMVGMALADTAVGLRANCALALARLGPPGIVVDLTILLFDAGLTASIQSDTLPVRREVARALGILGDPSGVLPLALALRSRTEEDPDVLVECMRSLAVLEQDRAMEFIGPYLEDPNPFLVAGAAMALGSTRRAEVLPALLASLDRTTGSLRDVMAMSVAALRVASARQALIDRAGCRSPSMRAAAVAALASFPDGETLALLERIAHLDTNPAVRRAAATALGRN